MRLAIIDYLGGEYNGSTLETKGLGGSESAVIYVSKELVKLGISVDIFNNCGDASGNYDGVNYINLNSSIPDNVRYDVVISSRISYPFANESNLPFAKYAKHKVVWMHDTFCNDEDSIEPMLAQGLIDEIWTLSDFHANLNSNNINGAMRSFEFMKKHMWVTRNGAYKWIDEIDLKQKDKNKFIYNASSIKGLIPLLNSVWPRVKEKIPQAKLTVVGGYYDTVNPGGQKEIVDNFLSDDRMKQLDVSFTGVITQKEVAEHFANAYMFIYPASTPETFGISAVESLLYNTPIITNNFGALEETAVDSCTFKINYPIEASQWREDIDNDYQIDAFVDTVIHAYNNEYLFLQKQNACDIIKDCDVHSWTSVAVQWKQHLFNKLGLFLDRDTFRQATLINDKVSRVFGRRFSNNETIKTYKKYNDEKRIVIISPFWNAKDYISKCIMSVAQQDYNNYFHVLLDDASDDDGADIAYSTIQSLPESIRDNFVVMKNDENVGCIANQLMLMEKVADDDIVILLDGDDWLINNNTIFTYYNELHHQGYDFTYGSTWSLADNIPLVGQTYPKDVIKNKSYRDHAFTWGIPYTHLRTFKGSLCKDLNHDVFKDNSNNYMKAGADNPLFYEMIEKSNNPLAVKEIVHVYNDKNPLNDYKIRSTEQNENAYGSKESDKTMRKKRILIALPTAKNIEPMTFHSIYHMIIPEGYECQLQFFYGYQVDQIRNMIANAVIEDNYDYLLSIDSDIILPSDTLVKLLSQNKDIISGMYRQRKHHEHIVEIFMRNEYGGVMQVPYYDMPDKDVFEIDACGMGVCLIKSEVFKKMSQPWFLYHSSLEEGGTLSEDVYFCMKAQEHGFKIWADKTIQVPHIGETTFEILGRETQRAKQQLEIAKVNNAEHYTFATELPFEPRCVWDVGSGFMHFSHAIKRVYPNVKTYCIDASPVLEKVYIEKKIPYERACVSDTVKQVKYYSTGYNIVGDSYFMETSGVYTEIDATRVTTTTLDKIQIQNRWDYPDLLKIDIQGAELDALNGAKSIMQHCKHVVLGVQFIEYNLGAPMAKDVLDYMTSLGFEFKKKYTENNIDALYYFAKL